MYVNEAMNNVTKYLSNDMEGRKLPKKASSPFLSMYDMVMDTR